MSLRLFSRTALRVVATTTLLSGAGLLSGCGSDGGTEPVGGGGGTFRATIDGTQWTSAATTAIAANGGIFTITGSQGTTAMSFTLYSIGAPGTYPLGVGGTVAGGIATLTTAPSSWSTPLSGAAGTITISAVSATRIAGTFSYTATPLIGQAAARSVTAGSFDVPVTGPATLVVPESAGGKVTGTIGGNAFNAATVVSVSAPSSGTLTIAGSNTAYTVNLILSGYTGVGTYALGSGVARTLQVTSAPPQKVWGGSSGANVGTVIITSATASRIKGTFTATLQPSVVNPSEAPLTLSGTFELGVP